MTHELRDFLISEGAQYATGAVGPLHFGDSVSEYEAAHRIAAVMDRSATAKIEVKGRDRVKFLHNLCTNDIKSLASGNGCEAFFCDAKGRILAFVRVFAEPDSLWLDTVPGAAPALIAHLDRYLITEQVELIDRSNDFAQIQIVGPSAAELTTTVAAKLPPPRDLSHTATYARETAIHVIFSDALALPSYELRVPVREAIALWQDVREAGQKLNARFMGSEAYEMVRIEAGWPVYGRDIDSSNFPQEVSRDSRAIHFTKGCYLGQETIARIDAMGHVNRHLVRLDVPGQSEPADSFVSAPLSVAGKEVGQIRSAARLGSAPSTVALAYVRRGLEKSGSAVTVQVGSSAIAATVKGLPKN